MSETEETASGEVTRILARAAGGEAAAASALLPLVYGELRALAGSFFRGQEAAHTLQPTALVHEAYMKLVGPAEVACNSRAHFFAVAAKAMRQILADHARRKRALKRGGGQQRVTLSGLQTPVAESEFDLVALDDALGKLAELDPRQCRIVEMRFLAGLTVDEVADLLGVSTPTVEREWRMARAWLRRELQGGAVP